LRSVFTLPLFALLIVLVAMPHPIVPLYESVVVAVLLVLTSHVSNPLTAMLAFKPLTYLGRISYSVYLWNQLFMIFGPHTRHPAAFVAVFMPATVLASYYLIEQPSIKLGSRLLRNRRQRLQETSSVPASAVLN
jgi:peptidoglycan/LPS O-acetylase OafA/YrhL